MDNNIKKTLLRIAVLIIGLEMVFLSLEFFTETAFSEHVLLSLASAILFVFGMFVACVSVAFIIASLEKRQSYDGSSKTGHAEGGMLRSFITPDWRYLTGMMAGLALLYLGHRLFSPNVDKNLFLAGNGAIIITAGLVTLAWALGMFFMPSIFRLFYALNGD